MQFLNDGKNDMQMLDDVEKEFAKIEAEKDKAMGIWLETKNMFQKAMQEENMRLMNEVQSFLEQGKGKMAFHYFAEARKMWLISMLICGESKYGLSLFCKDCEEISEVFEKYMMVTFALRRIAISLSQESVDEAVLFLRNSRISYMAIISIVKKELIIFNKQCISFIAVTFQDIWSDEELQNFLAWGENNYNE